MADDIVADAGKWPTEEIPDQATLFFRVHRAYYVNAQLNVGVFRNRGRGMSTDWDKYSAPEESRRRATVPGDNGILVLPVTGVRQIEEQAVEHTPDRARNNRAHTEVLGPKDVEVRAKLERIAIWAILPDAPVTDPSS